MASSIGVGAPGQEASSCERISVRDSQMSAGIVTETAVLLVFMIFIPALDYFCFG